MRNPYPRQLLASLKYGPTIRPFTYWDFMRARAKGNTIRPSSVDVEGETQYISVEMPADMGPMIDNLHPRPPFTQKMLYDSLPIWYREYVPVPQEDAVYGRLFFTSTHGFMGLVPRTAKAGDHIYVFLSGATPVVLRPKTSGDDRPLYGFVGECYVYGLMNHESWMAYQVDCSRILFLNRQEAILSVVFFQIWNMQS